MNYIINQGVEKVIVFVNILYLLLFLRDVNEGYVSLKDPDDKQSKFAYELKNADKDVKSVENRFF